MKNIGIKKSKYFYNAMVTIFLIAFSINSTYACPGGGSEKEMIGYVGQVYYHANSGDVLFWLTSYPRHFDLMALPSINTEAGKVMAYTVLQAQLNGSEVKFTCKDDKVSNLIITTQ
ncbi:exported hypothetical protein [Xenorhabdus innexi]|uniref:Uncharacterized protein n=2 Tax=Xenorhabdus innexi TaxID=290109 RepID=A0A1N6MTS6_9GAMM|nr:hypothetical protein [Xenorhabdus innexi]PHM36871.1 hypothetical protein Xinn_01405 [Xenorhabdus innexi]SIP72232.1 exported hypothetical protein [Xenorhabdus innexi]